MLDEKTRLHIEECRQEMEEHLGVELARYRFSDEQIEDIAERAATKALAKITDMAYREVGKSVISKLFYITGVLAVAAYLYAQSHGWLK